jgi:hypothetical protein
MTFKEYRDEITREEREQIVAEAIGNQNRV